ncbi:MAG TPA: glutaredoxin domain-containing protein [Candidatus Mcinerneyibacterium sp.]|nr:glutaredoxin domain-containing protein [Candidatus Mcinerneyibacterium sp.]
MANNVIVYSTPSCPYCNMAKQYFKENDVDFVDYDVSKDREKAKEMINKSGQQGVPVIDIDGEIIVGFDKNRIESLISE